jgi:hypothetical protein
LIRGFPWHWLTAAISVRSYILVTCNFSSSVTSSVSCHQCDFYHCFHVCSWWSLQTYGLHKIKEVKCHLGCDTAYRRRETRLAVSNRAHARIKIFIAISHSSCCVHHGPIFVKMKSLYSEIAWSEIAYNEGYMYNITHRYNWTL